MQKCAVKKCENEEHLDRIYEPVVDDNDFIEDDQNGLIVFEENLTTDGLIKIVEESKTWPVSAQNKEEYEIVYEQHQRFKRLSVAIRKRAEEYIKEAKQKFYDRKNKIEKDLNLVLDIINPLIKKLGESRQRYDDEENAYKENRARDEAKRQEDEQKRQQLIRDEIRAHEENKLFDERKRQAEEGQRIADEQARLRRERYEFECEKSRLDFDEAWDETHPTIEEQNVNDDDLPDFVKEIEDDLSDLESINVKVTGKPVSRDSTVIRGIFKSFKDFISFAKSMHKGGLSDPKMQAELGNFISRVNMNFKNFQDAINLEDR